MSDLPNAPPLGRVPVIVQAGGRTFRVTPLPPRAAVRVCFRVAKLVGNGIAGLFAGAGLDLGLKLPDGQPLLVTFGILLKYAPAREALFGRILEAIAGMEPDDLTELVDELLVGYLEVNVAGAWIPCKDAARVDAEVPDPWSLLMLTKAAFSAAALPTSAAAGSSRPAADPTPPLDLPIPTGAGEVVI